MSTRFTLCSVVILSLCCAEFTMARPRGRGPGMRRTRIVSPVPGNPVASGNRLLDTLADITTASATDPWLVKLEPGIYDVENLTVTMLSFVDIEGSGENLTTITGFGSPTLLGASDAELSDVTVEQRGGSGVAIQSMADRFAMYRVTAISDGTGAILISGNDADMSFVTARLDASGSGTGISISGARGQWKCIDVTAMGNGITYALFNHGDGEFNEIRARSESGTAFAGAIRNEGSDPIMRDVDARAKGATIGQAITNGGGSSAQLFDVLARAAGEEFAVGISNQSGSPRIENADIEVEGGMSAFGVSNQFGADVTLHDITAVANGNGRGAGLITTNATKVSANGSTFQGDQFSVDNRFHASNITLIGSSQLIGPVNSGMGMLKCAVSYDGSYDPLRPDCMP